MMTHCPRCPTGRILQEGREQICINCGFWANRPEPLPLPAPHTEPRMTGERPYRKPAGKGPRSLAMHKGAR